MILTLPIFLFNNCLCVAPLFTAAIPLATVCSMFHIGKQKLHFLSFVLGLSLGTTLMLVYTSLMVQHHNIESETSMGPKSHSRHSHDGNIDSFVGKSPHEHKRWENLLAHLPGHNHSGHVDDVMSWSDADTHSHIGENLLAAELYRKVNIFCWIMTSPKNIESKARHVKATWARRFNKYLFMSSKEDKNLPAIGLKLKEGRDYLWEKTKLAFRYVYNNYLDKHDWFMKADDDTYVVVENLRYMLKDVDPNKPYYLGRRFKPYVKQGYMSGGGGYVLSRQALKLFIEEGLDKNKHGCRAHEHGGAEDVNMGESKKS